jgi:hypothetical protein
MIERFERRTIFAFGNFFAIVALLVTGFVFQLNAQESIDGPVARPEGTRAKYLSFYGTGRADWATILPGAVTGEPHVWKIRKNQAGPEVSTTFNFGVFGDSIMPGSYTGDATFDPTIFRPSTGTTWLVGFEDTPENPPYTAIQYGPLAAANPGRNGDYDGDGIDDITLLRVQGGVVYWWMRLSSNPSSPRVVPFGTTAAGTSLFVFQGADFTGDGRDELVVARANTTAPGAVTWWIGDSVTGAQIHQIGWANFNTDFIINPADYTGDGRADIVAWRAGSAGADAAAWYIYSPATGLQSPLVWFGIPDPAFEDMDLPVRGDYDGDGIHDIAVWRPSNQTFWARASSNGSLIIQQWGGGDDTPLGHLFVF